MLFVLQLSKVCNGY